MKKKKCSAHCHRVFNSTLVLGILSILLFVCLPANLYAQPIPAVPVIGEDEVANICYTENDGITGSIKCKKFSLNRNLILEEKIIDSYPLTAEAHVQTTKSGAVVYLLDDWISRTTVLKYVFDNGDVHELYRGPEGLHFIDVTTIDGVDYVALINTLSTIPFTSTLNLYELDRSLDQPKVWNNALFLEAGEFVEIDGLRSNHIHLVLCQNVASNPFTVREMSQAILDFDNRIVRSPLKRLVWNYGIPRITGGINNSKPFVLKVNARNEPHLLFAYSTSSFTESSYYYAKLDPRSSPVVLKDFPMTSYADFGLIDQVVPIILAGVHEQAGLSVVTSIGAFASSNGISHFAVLGVPALGSDIYNLLSVDVEANGAVPRIAAASIKNSSEVVLFELEEQGFKEHVLGPIRINNNTQISASFID